MFEVSDKYKIQIRIFFLFYRSCSGLVVTSYNHFENAENLFEKHVAKSYNAFKKNPKMEFDFDSRSEVESEF